MKTILVADDDDSLRRLYPPLIGKMGYETLAAENGNEALEIARRELPDLLLTDTEMPGLKGYEVCKELKQDPKTSHIKVIGITGNGDGYKENYIESNADGYLKKPILLDTLESTLKELLGE
jgi:CheY-like chemotaxis protein